MLAATLKTTPAYIATIGPDRTLVLPSDMPVGATVAVIMVPDSTSEPDNEARRARFAATLEAIRATTQQGGPIELFDEELSQLVEKARGVFI